MSKEEAAFRIRARFFADAKRVTVAKYSRLDKDGNFVDFWMGRLRSRNVCIHKRPYHRTPKLASLCADKFRRQALSALAAKENEGEKGRD